MIEEKTFSDIRRNYILSSVIFILFLIYWWRIEINKILFFDLSWEWYYFSPFIDIFILLLIFFLYTFIRYIIYAKYEIKEKWYYFNRLYRWIKNTNIDDYSKKIYINENKKEIILNWISINKRSGKNELELQLSYKDWNISWTNISIKKIKQYSFNKNEITFEFLWSKVILRTKEWKNNYFKTDYSKFVFDLDYSNFIWPLSLIFIIYFILIVKLTYFLFYN